MSVVVRPTRGVLGLCVRAAAARPATAIVIAVLALSGGCAPLQVQPAATTVEGRVRGQDGAHRDIADTVLALRHDATTTMRTLYRAAATQQHVRDLRLTMTAATGLPFAEEWHLLHLSRRAQRPGDDPVIVEFTGDPGFVRRHTGELAWVTIRRHDLALPSGSFAGFPPASLRPGGATVLARVEDDDPVLPWTSNACDPAATLPLAATLRALAPAGGGDCFDLQSLASTLLNQLAVTVSDGARTQGARAVSHALAIVPHVAVPATGGAPAPRPGIGFIYRTTLEPVVAGTGVAPFTGTLTVSVPITWVFGRSPGDNGIATALDPITVALPGTVLANVERITVSAVDGSIASSFAGQLRAAIAAAVTAAPTPTGPGGLPLNSFIDLLLVLTVLADQPALPPDFSVLALPANRAVSGAPDNTALTMGAIAISERSGVTPALPGGTGARSVLLGAGGAVSVVVNLNAAGTRVRRFDLPLPGEPLPFDLVVLR